MLEGFGDLHDLPPAVVRTVIDRGSDGGGAQIPGLFHRCPEGLIVIVGVGQHLVVIDLDQERDLVSIGPRHRPQNSKCRGHRVAAALERQLDDVGRVEVDRIGCERGGTRVLDALVHRQNRYEPGTCHSARVEDPLHGCHHLR